MGQLDKLIDWFDKTFSDVDWSKYKGKPEDVKATSCTHSSAMICGDDCTATGPQKIKVEIEKVDVTGVQAIKLKPPEKKMETSPKLKPGKYLIKRSSKDELSQILTNDNFGLHVVIQDDGSSTCSLETMMVACLMDIRQVLNDIKTELKKTPELPSTEFLSKIKDQFDQVFADTKPVKKKTKKKEVLN